MSSNSLRERRLAVKLHRYRAEDLDIFFDLDIMAQELRDLTERYGEEEAVDTIVEWYPKTAKTSSEMKEKLEDLGSSMSTREFVVWGKRNLAKHGYFIPRKEDGRLMQWVFNPAKRPKYDPKQVPNEGSRLLRVWTFMTQHPMEEVSTIDVLETFGDENFEHALATLANHYAHRGVEKIGPGTYRFNPSKMVRYRKLVSDQISLDNK